MVAWVVLGGFCLLLPPYVLSLTLASGVANRLNIVWLPLFALSYFNLVETGSLKHAVYAALMFCATLGCYVWALCLLARIGSLDFIYCPNTEYSGVE